MNLGVLITALVMLAIMCSPIIFFRNKGKKKDKKDAQDEQKENKEEK